jgi:glycosyltransferase involved in cell wall biosynthesis
MKGHLKSTLPELRKVILGCGKNIWAYPALSDPDFLHRIGLREAIREMASALPPSIVVADLGCGWMPYREWFDASDRTYIPLDVTAYPDDRFRIIRDGRIPLNDASVDTLACWQVLEHVRDMELFFCEVTRILQPGGRAFFTTHGLFRIHDREDFWRWTPAGLRLLFESRGFVDFKVKPCDSAYSIIASLINNAWRLSESHGVSCKFYNNVIFRIVNLFGLAADKLSNAIKLTGHHGEASTYLIEVTRVRDKFVTPAALSKPASTETPSVRVCVAVCTRNRAAELKRTLQSLQTLDYPSSLTEFIIVDNCSADDTSDIAASWCAQRGNARYFHEPRPGLPFARNLAWQQADAELVVFLDDDALPETGWLRAIAQAYVCERDRDSSRHLAIGGRVKLRFPDSTPDVDQWLGDDMLGWLSKLDYGPDTFVLDKPLMHLVGANFAVPLSTLKFFEGFSEHVHGTYGDERGLEKRIRASGGHLVYAGGAVVHHQIAQQRLTQEWFRKRLWSEGSAVAHLGALGNGVYSILALRTLARSVKSLLAGGWGILRNSLEPTPAHFAQSCRFWFACGLLSATWRMLLRRDA